MPTFPAPAGQITVPRHINKGSLLTLTPGAGAIATLEYTYGDLAAITNRTAVWNIWPKGPASAAQQDLLAESAYVRVTSIGGAASSLNVEPFPTPTQLAAFRLAFGGSAAGAPGVIVGANMLGAIAVVIPSNGYTYTTGVWDRSGTPIADQTSLTYQRTAADVGQTLWFTPTGSTERIYGGGTMLPVAGNSAPTPATARLMFAASRLGAATDWGISDGTPISTTNYRLGSSGGQVTKFMDRRVWMSTTWRVIRGRFLLCNSAIELTGCLPGLFAFQVPKFEIKRKSDNVSLGFATYQAATSWTMPAGVDLWTDQLSFDIPENGDWWVDCYADIPAGSAYPGINNIQLQGELAHESLTYNGAVSGMTTSYTFGSKSVYFAPTAFAGEGWDGSPVVCGLGDSLNNYTTTGADFATARGDVGYGAVGFGDTTQGRWNYVSFARYSTSLPTLYVDGFNSTPAARAIMPWLDGCMKQIQTQPMFNMIYCNHGHNDINTGYAQMVANLGIYSAKVKSLWGNNMVLVHDTIPPDTAGTTPANFSGFTTVADQTPTANFTVAGTWGQWNTYIRGGGAVAAGYISLGIDTCGDLGDPTNPDRWAARPFTAQLAAAVVNTSNVILLTAQAPARETLVLDVGISTVDTSRSSMVYTVVSSISDGAGNFTTTLNGGRNTRYQSSAGSASRPNAHAIGGTVRAVMAPDGTHHAQIGQDFRATRLIAQKAAMKALIPAA